MILKKEKVENLEKNIKIFKTISILLFMLTILFPIKLDAMANSFNIVLPQKVAGIEKIEYLVDGTPMGNTSGTQSISLSENQKIRFLVKFESESYKNLKASDIKIVSQSGTSLPLNIYMYDENQNLVTRQVNDDELIDSQQTYTTLDTNIYQNEIFEVSGVKIDTNSVSFKLSDDFGPINNILDVEYKINSSDFQKAIFDENNNKILINDIPNKASLKIFFNLKDAYSNSKLTVFSDKLDINSKDNSVYIQSLNSDLDIDISNVEKNKYTLNFNSSKDGSFKSVDNLEKLSTVGEVLHGDNYSFIYDADTSLSENQEITANNIALKYENGVYTIENISENMQISIKDKKDTYYPISFGKLSEIAQVYDMNSNEISDIYNLKYDEELSFKLSALSAYSQNIEQIELYNVPYDVSENEDISKYKITPSLQDVYQLPKLNKPSKIVVKNAKKNTYEVVMPKSLVGVSYEILESPNSYVEENKVYIEHGNPIYFKFYSKEGYDISDIEITSSQKSNINVVKKEENLYEVSNINSDLDMIVSNIKIAKCKLNFECLGFDIKDTNNKKVYEDVYIDYQKGEFTFKPSLKTGYTLNSIANVQITGGNAKIKKLPDSDFYTVYDVTNDSKISVTGAKAKLMKVNLSSEKENIVFQNADNQIVVPSENKVEYGSEFKFKVASKNGEDLSNLNVETTSGVPVDKVFDEPNTYSIKSTTLDTNITVSKTLNNSSVQNFLSGTTKGYTYARYYNLYANPYSDLIDLQFLNARDQNIPDNRKTCEIKYITDGYGNYTLNYKTIRFQIASTDAFNITDEQGNANYDIKFMEQIEKNYSENIPKYNIDTSDPTKHIVTMTIPFAEDNTSSNTETSYYCTDSIIQVTPKQSLSNFNVIFPSVEGVKFNEVTDTTSYLQGATLTLGKSYKASSTSYYFSVQADENYEFDGIEVIPGNFCKIEEVTLTGKKYKVYQISDNYSENLTVSVKNLRKKQVNYSFVTSTGTTFYDSNGMMISNTKTLQSNYGEKCIFDIEPQEGYKDDIEEISFKIGGINTLISGLELGDLNKEGTIYKHDNVSTTFKLINEEGKLKLEFSNTKVDISDINVIRNKKTFKLRFTNSDEVTFTNISDNKDIDTKNEFIITYGNDFTFIVKPKTVGYDISNIVVTENNTPITKLNGRYVIKNIQEDKDIGISGVEKVSENITFVPYDGVTYKNTNNEVINESIESKFGENIEFYIRLSDSISDSNISVKAENQNTGEIKEIICDPYTKLYKLENIQSPYKIRVENITLDTLKVKFKKSDDVNYYNQYATESLISDDITDISNIVKKVKYGDSISFRILAKEGKDISNLKVFYKTSDTDLNPVEQQPSSTGIYTIENITSDGGTVYVSGGKSVNYQVELRTISGAKYVDEYGNVLSSVVTVPHGSNLSFKLSVDSIYKNSVPEIEEKGSGKKIKPVNGVYTIENITENKILNITNMIKNSYKVTFKPTEGVKYKTSKNKDLEDTVTIEQGENLEFMLSLLEAYDNSSPYVLLNEKNALEAVDGIYKITNINKDIQVSVKNVVKNEEESTIEDIIKIPDRVSTQEDVDAVVNATNSYNNLSDDRKSLVTNLNELKTAQKNSAIINHTSENITVMGLDWNIKLVVIDLSNDQEAVNELNSEIERKSLVNLYDLKLYDVLTGKVYEVPYGKEVNVSIPVADLSQYENLVVVHKNNGGGIEYLDVDITDGKAKFKTTSFSRFGIAGKKIPNYLENPSNLTVSVSDLVENEDELKSLLGEGLSSELGSLINNEDENKEKEVEVKDSIYEENKELTFWKKLYNWAVNHELVSVIIVIIFGILIIALILFLGRKKKDKK